MKQHKLSAGKRLAKPILFGTIIVGLAAAFINRLRPQSRRVEAHIKVGRERDKYPPWFPSQTSKNQLHRFFEDVVELRAQERARNDTKRLEVLERRQKQIDELTEKKQQGGSG